MKNQKNGGFISFIIIIVLSVIILSLLGVSIGSLINNKTLRENFAFLWDLIVWLWTMYAAPFWNFIQTHIIDPIRAKF